MSNLAAGGFGPSGDKLKALETEIKAGALCLDPQSRAEAILTASLATREYVPPHEIDHSIQDCQVLSGFQRQRVSKFPHARNC